MTSRGPMHGHGQLYTDEKVRSGFVKKFGVFLGTHVVSKVEKYQKHSVVPMESLSVYI